MNQLINYVRKENNVPIAVFVAYQTEDRVRIGYATCHPNDTFDKKWGKIIAFGRADKFDQKKQINVPQRIATEFFAFLQNCLDRQSFQGKYFPRWMNDPNNVSFPGVVVDIPKAMES